MARQINWKPRLIYPTCTTSASLNSVSALAEILWWRLIACADDQGRLSGAPKDIKRWYAPFRPEVLVENIPELLHELNEDMLVVYGNPPVIQILNWWGWEHPQWAYPSSYPAKEGWADHYRYCGPGRQIITHNWPPPSSKVQVATTCSAPSRPGGDYKEEEEEEEKEKEEEDFPAANAAGDKTSKKQSESQRSKVKTPNPLVASTMKWIEENRGWVSPHHARECKAVKWMLDHNYVQQQIQDCYLALKKDKYWAQRELFMWVVQDKIGAMVKGESCGGLTRNPKQGWRDWEKLKKAGVTGGVQQGQGEGQGDPGMD